MHIGIVTPRYPPNIEGGGEISVQMLAEHLDSNDRVDEVTVLSFDGVRVEKINDIKVHRVREISSLLTEWQNIRAYRPLVRTVAQLDIDIVHAYNMELHPAVGRLTAATAVDTVATLNSYHFLPSSVANTDATGLDTVYELCGYPTTGRILRHYMSRIDRFVALSSTLKRIYSRHGLDSDHIEIIPNMYDPMFSVPTVEADDDESVMLLYVGVLKEIKGIEFLIRAIAELSSEYKLKVVGDGPLLSEMQSLSRELGVDQRITFAGHVPYEKVPKAYAKADIFVHPGVWPEPFSRTVVEAMQAGLPVVSTDVGGHTDVIQDDELLCRSEDPQALADAIGRATQHREAYAGRNQRYVEQNLSPQSVTDRIVDLYERQVSGL